jgi:hypothetical protein
VEASISFRHFQSFRQKISCRKFSQVPSMGRVPFATIAGAGRWFPGFERRINMIKRTLAVLATVGAIGAAAVAVPAPAEARGIGPGLAFGLAAGALTAGAIAATHPYYGYGYGPGYYYGPRTYYAPAPYYGGPYYHHYYRDW